MKLKATQFVKFYGKKKVVDGVNIEVASGEVVGLLGPNGAGKTTIFYSIMGVVAPDEGRCMLDDRDITDAPLYKKARLGIGYLAQEPSVFTGLTAFENLMAVGEFLEKDPSKREKKVAEVMDIMGMQEFAHRKAAVLSGGEKRRVEIARILLLNPSFLLLDEPFVGIDPIAVEDLRKIVLDLKKRNIGILITDHNVRETLKVIDRAYIIYQGKILVEGTSQDLTSSSKAREIYLGHEFDL